MDSSQGWAEVLADVAGAIGTAVTVRRRLVGGLNGGAVRVRLAGGPDAVLKVLPRAHPQQLAETRRARGVAEHMRGCGYPTPAWLAVGATAEQVWQLTEFVDAAPAAEFTPALVEQLLEIVELQAGRASVSYDHWSYAWRVATGQDTGTPGETPEQAGLRRSIDELTGCSAGVSALVWRARAACVGVPEPPAAPDMVHADLATPGNVLVRGTEVVAVVDIGNAGSGTRAIDLTSLLWVACSDPRLDQVRRRLWRRVLDLVGGDGAAVLTTSHLLHMLELGVRSGHGQAVPAVIECGRRVLDELDAIRRPT